MTSKTVAICFTVLSLGGLVTLIALMIWGGRP